MNGNLLVSRLTAFFSGLAANARGLVNQHYGRLHLVTMLTSWPATPLTPDDALSEQFCGRHARRMNIGLHGVRAADELGQANNINVAYTEQHCFTKRSDRRRL